MPDSISGDNWEVGEKFTFFLSGSESMFDNNCREYSECSPIVTVSVGKT